MKKISNFLLGPAVFLVSFLTLFILCEICVRFISGRRLIYPVEMARYTRLLQVHAPLGKAGHRHKINASAKLMGVDITLNSLGNRGPELAQNKPKSTKRVFVLGSSMTMGWGVQADKVFTALLERRLNQGRPLGKHISFECVNSGIGNYNIHYQSELLQEQFALVKPDYIVLNYFIDDAKPDPEPSRFSALLKKFYSTSILYGKISALQFMLKGKTLGEYYAGLYQEQCPRWKDTLSRAEEMNALARKNGVPFLIVIVPDFRNLGPDSPYKGLYRQIGAGFAKAGIPTVNSFDIFQQRHGKNPSELWIQSDDPHPNALGHETMSDVVFDALTERVFRTDGHL